MEKLDVKQNTPDWLESRKGRVTGSKLKDILTNSRGGNYVGWYEFLAEQIEKPTGEEVDGENAHDRGHRLEPEALELFCMKNDIDLNEVIDDGFYVSESDDRLGNSPDAVYNSEKSEVEVKCLDKKYHLQHYLEGYLEDEIPNSGRHKFKAQLFHSFIVNDKLEEKHLVLYCPQLPDIAMYSFTVTREEFKDEIEDMKKQLNDRLAEAESIIARIKSNNQF